MTLVDVLESTDPLDWAGWVAAHDDSLVLEGLSATGNPLAQGAAVLCARWISFPQEAIPALIPLAVGRDPDIAPMATMEPWQIAQGWATSHPNQEEPGLPSGALDELSAAASDATLRADIRQALALSHALLAGIEESTSED